MMNFSAFKIRLTALAAGAWLVGASVASAQSRVGVFPAPTCNASQAIEHLKLRIDKDPVPTGDGYFPWSGALGWWVSASRGAYLQVTSEELTGSDYGVARVVIRSICDDSVLAMGTKVIYDTDWDATYMVVALRNYKLAVNKRAHLVAAFEVQDAKKQACQLSLQMLEVDEMGGVTSKDYFRIVRP